MTTALASGRIIGQRPSFTKDQPKRAVDMEQLAVWAYMVQRVDAAEVSSTREHESLTMGRGESGCGMPATERFSMLGGWVDGGSTDGLGFDAASDAITIHNRVQRLADRTARSWVKHYAKAGAPPSWRGVGSGWGPKDRDAAGEAKTVRYDHNRKRSPEYCPIVWIDRGETLALARERYRLWHDGLSQLARFFARYPFALKRHRVVGFAAHPEPWRC